MVEGGSAPPHRVIVCCSAEDRPFVERLRQHVKPLRQGGVRLWERGDVPAGARVQEAVQEAWREARAVVLLVSPGFLAEEFAPGSEIHAAVAGARARGLPILWIAVSYSAYRQTELAALAPLNDPERPLDGLADAEANRVLVAISEQLVAAVLGGAEAGPAGVREAVPGRRGRGALLAVIAGCVGLPALVWLVGPGPEGDDGTRDAASTAGSEGHGLEDRSKTGSQGHVLGDSKGDGPNAPVSEDMKKLGEEPRTAQEELAARAAADCTRAGGCPVRWEGARVEAITAGPGYSRCAVLADGALRCWGRGETGALGLGTLEPRPWPEEADLAAVPVVDAGGKVRAVASGKSHTCALMELHGRVRCWGASFFGQLGYGPTQNLGDEPGEMPTANVAIGASVEQIAAGESHTCVIVAGGTVRCWGYNSDGQLANGKLGDITGDDVDEMPPGSVPGVSGATQLVAGAYHTCALVAGGKVRCWGQNEHGELGVGSKMYTGQARGPTVAEAAKSGGGVIQSFTPRVVALGGEVEQISAGQRHTCALLRGGKVRCWGANDAHQLGYEDPQSVGDEPGEMPPEDVTIGGRAVQIAAGWMHTCALLESKTVRCWGDWQRAQLGHGLGQVRRDRMPPEDVPVGGEVARLISSGGAFTCVQLVDDSLRCWGRL